MRQREERLVQPRQHVAHGPDALAVPDAIAQPSGAQLHETPGYQEVYEEEDDEEEKDN